jgi:hypothetical protein
MKVIVSRYFPPLNYSILASLGSFCDGLNVMGDGTLTVKGRDEYIVREPFSWTGTNKLSSVRVCNTVKLFYFC